MSAHYESTLRLLDHSAASAGSRKFDIIWNLTLICPWNCEACCVAAIHARKHGAKLLMSSNDLSRYEELPFDPAAGSVWDQAAKVRQHRGHELNLAGKLQVLEHLAGLNVKIDFSGGDVLSVTENLVVLRTAAHRFGQENITLTATGTGLAQRDVRELAAMIGEFNFTYDSVE